MRREAGAEGGHEDPVSRAEVVIEDFFESEEDRVGQRTQAGGLCH